MLILAFVLPGETRLDYFDWFDVFWLIVRSMFAGLAVDKCYVGVLEVYENPRTLTMLDLMEVSIMYHQSWFVLCWHVFPIFSQLISTLQNFCQGKVNRLCLRKSPRWAWTWNDLLLGRWTPSSWSTATSLTTTARLSSKLLWSSPTLPERNFALPIPFPLIWLDPGWTTEDTSLATRREHMNGWEGREHKSFSSESS